MDEERTTEERTTVKAEATKAFEEGTLKVEPAAPRRRRRFNRSRRPDNSYYDNVEDRREAEEKRRLAGNASTSFTDVVTQASIKQKKKDDLEVRPLPVKILGSYPDPELGPCAVCTYVAKDAPKDDPVLIYVPYEKFTEMTDADLRRSHIGSRKKFIDMRSGAKTDVIVESFRRAENGAPMFIGSRNLAMKYNRMLWFVTIPGDSQVYRYSVGSRLQARVAFASNSGLFCEILGEETYIPVQEITHNPTVMELTGYKPGDTPWVEITNIERDEKERRVRVDVSIKKTIEDPQIKAARILQAEMDLNGKIVFLRRNPTPPTKPYCFVEIEDIKAQVRCILEDRWELHDEVNVHVFEPFDGPDGKKKIVGRINGHPRR